MRSQNNQSATVIFSPFDANYERLHSGKLSTITSANVAIAVITWMVLVMGTSYTLKRISVSKRNTTYLYNHINLSPPSPFDMNSERYQVAPLPIKDNQSKRTEIG